MSNSYFSLSATVFPEDGGYRMAWVGYAEPDAQKNIRPVAQAGDHNGVLQDLKLTTSTLTWIIHERDMGAIVRVN